MAEPRAGWNISCIQKRSKNLAAALYILSELPQQSPLDLLDSPMCAVLSIYCQL